MLRKLATIEILKFVAFLVLLQLQNTDSSTTISRATSLDGSFTRANVGNYKSGVNQSFLLFRHTCLHHPNQTGLGTRLEMKIIHISYTRNRLEKSCDIM